MKTLAKKTKVSLIMTVELVLGVIIMAGAVIVTPAGIISIDPTLLTDPFVLAVVALAMLFFAGIGYFGFVRPYLLYRRLPEIQAETDGTYLYIHSKKEAKIPLAEMEGTYLGAETPYVRSREFLVHLFTEHYGHVVIEVPKYGKYKLYYISKAREVPKTISALIESKL